MTGLTPYFVNKVMDHCLGGVSWTPPAAVYLQLHIGDPGPDGTANVSATTTRRAVTWSSASNGQINMTSDLTWTAVAKESISHISGWDASSSGHCLFTDEFDDAKNCYVGDTLELPSATVQIPPGA